MSLFDLVMQGKVTLSREDGSEIKPEEIGAEVAETESPDVEVNVEAEGDAEVEVNTDADGAEVITDDSELETELVEQDEANEEVAEQIDDAAESVEENEEAVATLEALYQNLALAKATGTANIVHADLCREHLDYVCTTIGMARDNSNTINIDHESAYSTAGMSAITTETVMEKVKETAKKIWEAIKAAVKWIAEKIAALFRAIIGLFKKTGNKIKELWTWFKNTKLMRVVLNPVFTYKTKKALKTNFDGAVNSVGKSISGLNNSLDKFSNFLMVDANVGNMIDKFADDQDITKFNHVETMFKGFGLQTIEAAKSKIRILPPGIDKYNKVVTDSLINGKALFLNDDKESKNYGSYDLLSINKEEQKEIAKQDKSEKVEVTVAEVEQLLSVLNSKVDKVNKAIEASDKEVKTLKTLSGKIDGLAKKAEKNNDNELIVKKQKEQALVVKNIITSYGRTKGKVAKELSSTVLHLTMFIDMCKKQVAKEADKDKKDAKKDEKASYSL